MAKLFFYKVETKCSYNNVCFSDITLFYLCLTNTVRSEKCCVYANTSNVASARITVQSFVLPNVRYSLVRIIHEIS